MKLLVEGSNLRGAVKIPGSKSHTIRAVAISSLAEGISIIESPLVSSDTLSAVHTYRSLGAEIKLEQDKWIIVGTGGNWQIPENVIDVGNSGTTMCIGLGSASLIKEGTVIMTGDEQVRRRPVGPLIRSLNDLGAKVESSRNNNLPPVIVKGILKGGNTKLEAISSQYLTSLLINTPIVEIDTEIEVVILNERPYVEMTLAWLRENGIKVSYDSDMRYFKVHSGQRYQPVHKSIPGDFSSATFFLCAGALPDNEVVCQGLDINDTQGDKAVLEYLRMMGASVTIEGNDIKVSAQQLKGCDVDMNATPDALPMMAVVGCFASGVTRLLNVPQARLKETDRIKVMCEELSKLGARIKELPDGLEIEESPMHPGEVDGHGDHRVVMALAIAGTMIPGTTIIDGYEAVNVTFPTFLDCLNTIGGKTRVLDK
ncbi:MAG: 3-phosphoshikimate 1-carboxyvinyltransferase [Candidatus Hydrogenedentes bacterium]|nr:3-phosphoshikimate 1-carboxyvinyltransferase [Candidatus Hydrogenedentota bacterium]